MTRYRLVCRTARGTEEFKVSDPEVKGHYLFAQLFRKPLAKSRMCRVDEIVSLTFEEESE